MDLFSIFWLGGVAFAAYWQAAWGWRAYKSGVATFYFHHEVRKDKQPFEFRMLLLGRIFAFVIAVGMFAFGLQFFWELGT